EFAGAAHELADSALLVNPFDVEACARAMAHAFAMPLDERRRRWRIAAKILEEGNVHDWCARFLATLDGSAPIRLEHPGPVSTTPSWFRYAVSYQLHVKPFFDGNVDGIGDFPGLLSRLDYIVDLGVDTFWLLLFYPSPRRDDGYDVADYLGVHPDYGSVED